MTARSRATIDDTGSSDCAVTISSSASSSRPSGARHEFAYQWCAVAYRGLRLMARRNSRSAPVQSQSCVALTCASDVCASADRSSSMTAVGGVRRGLGPHVGRRQHAVVRQETERVGQPAVRRRVLGAFGERLLEELHGLDEAILRALIEVIAALQIQILGGQVLGGTRQPVDADVLRRAPDRFAGRRPSAICSWAAKASSAVPVTDSDQM